VRSLYAERNDALIFMSAQDVIRNSYFYQAQAHESQSDGIESEIGSGFLVENNIFQ